MGYYRVCDAKEAYGSADEFIPGGIAECQYEEGDGTEIDVQDVVQLAEEIAGTGIAPILKVFKFAMFDCFAVCEGKDEQDDEKPCAKR
mmetsp:Transcript_35533/g.40357  ORF Transcript_35533/g.40357 Transcript_35533/m.40357 type:complete len:88 (-) Transcript_35533:808-1071(-)